ncbi:hypothetical protein Hanom_Chr07g00657221 [Helianthus anomalus]
MQFSSLRFSQFCNFRPKVFFSAFGSKRFKIFAIFIRLVNSIHFSPFEVRGIFVFFVNLKGNSVFLHFMYKHNLHKVKKT